MTGGRAFTVLVTSHRGGCGKTALAAGLAQGFASAGNATMLVDAGYVPTSAAVAIGGEGKIESVTAETNLEHIGTLPMARHPRLGLLTVHAPALLDQPERFDRILLEAPEVGAEFVVVDFPVCGEAELSFPLRRADVVLCLVPCDGPGFKSLAPFLEFLQRERAKPGRAFSTRAVLVGTGVPAPEHQALEEFERQYLRPFLMNNEVPMDRELRAAMAEMHLPSPRGECHEAGTAMAAYSAMAEELAALREALPAAGAA